MTARGFRRISRMNDLKNLQQTAIRTQLYLPGSGILPRESEHRKPLTGALGPLRLPSDCDVPSSCNSHGGEPPQRSLVWERVSVVRTNTSLEYYCGTPDHKSRPFPQHHIQQRDSAGVYRPGFRLVTSRSVTEHKRWPIH